MFSSAHPYAHFLRLWLTVLTLLGAWPAQAAFIDQGDGTVSDTLTGLMWDKCSSGQSGSACASGSASTHTWAAAQSLAASANATAYRGHNDWRLPNFSELESLVKIDASNNPAIDSSTFPNTQSFYYWSSSLYTPGPAVAWGVHFGNGVSDAGYQSYDNHVRLVRSGQSFDSFDSLATQASVSFVSSFISADEASRSATAIVTRSATTTGGAATVHYVTANGTALAGTDYTATSGLLSWAAGEVGPKSIIIPLTDDLLVKGTRRFSVLLSDPTGTLISGASSATIEISDNDHNTPDPFSFTPQTGVALNATITSNPITVHGTNAPAAISVSNGSYSVNGLPFVSIIGSVNSGDTVLVHVLSASTAGAVRTAMLTIGGVSAGFAVTTRPYDITPDPFSFTPQTGVALNATITSNPITVSGIDVPAPISVSNGSYSVNGLPFVSIIGSVNNSDTVLVHVLSASTAGAVRTAMLTIGGVSAGFTVTTRPYNISATPNPTAGGSASCTPNQVNHNGTSTCAAIPATGYNFTGWSGDCTGLTCSLSNISAAKSVTANFTLKTYVLTTTSSPTAGGTASCTPNPVSHNTNSICTALPATGYNFTGWSGDCTGSTCSLTNVTAAKRVTANFTLKTYVLTTTTNPTASGTASCTPNPVSHGATGTCTAAPATGYNFSGWSGDCTGSTCSLSNIIAAKRVTANFTLKTYVLTTTSSPTTGGTASCTPNPVNHGAIGTCTAVPATGYNFSGWSGDCTGSTCSLSNIIAGKRVTANFTLKTYVLTTTSSPTTGGTASCTPNPVNHGAIGTCTAVPATGYNFSGWSGDCTGSTCSLTNVTAAKSVTANFMANSTSYLSAAPGSPALPGQTTTLSAQVRSAAGTPTGNVVFKEGGTLLGTAPLINGVATYQAGIFGVGTHSLSARYEGNAVYHYSEGNLNYQVAEKIDSTLAVRTKPNLSQTGDSVPVTVTVTPLNNVGALSGSIEVSSDGQNCHITLPAVSCTLVFASKGVKKLTATYSGNSLYTPASGSGIHFVGKRASLTPILMLLLD